LTFIIDANVEISSTARRKRACQPYYDNEAAEVLIKPWKFFRHVLVPLLRATLDAISRNRRFRMSAEVKKKLPSISRAAREGKKHAEGKERCQEGNPPEKPNTGMRVWAWDEKNPSFCETDTVSHDGGGGITPYYAWTIAATDAALGWTEVRPLRIRPKDGHGKQPATYMTPFQSLSAALTRTLARPMGVAGSSISILRNGAVKKNASLSDFLYK
jgi:hypothetical protein